MNMSAWALPEYIEDILPAEALKIEMMRRRVLDWLFVNGYELVGPPLLEYVESLLTGSGGQMNLRVLKVVDQLSGRMMGLRADMTPQVARIDAHLLNRKGITRLCYAGSVLHARPSGLTRTREPLQIGAELYGHQGLESDLEIQRLMLQSLAIAGVGNIHLDLGHVAVFRGLIRSTGISPDLEMELSGALQGKDKAALKELCAGLKKQVDASVREALQLLPELYGDENVLTLARSALPSYPGIMKALDELEMVASELSPLVDTLAFDLADLRGYHYHSGMVFAAYTDNCPNAIAVGGRYDEVGKAFGRARPATGFSMDLRELSGLMSSDSHPRGILAPFIKEDKALEKKIEQLRNEGQIVIVALPGHENDAGSFNCDKKLVSENGVWSIADALI
ncbi:ATP phosphoribosyltransferase regulatory subunit [Nitrosospira multiformis ATCC 25196]|uniref:ATP phosphoribosyltransferase regulatory subunit n=3 Tax=Nitrosospira multiformis TaxID=1231 RepID=HISZ_NITMU|nr:RecName: Full=ATP phosphoribosyltransferase regulatory subunit [Nitrosospira multiformis ATCC 25196]ABB73750.1 tRNA synthetase, class II (G, H, P and S) [Nitrosospira multiformis ATCC 25196]SEF41049.1 ATP phosphoribosyltransferase regulatory subunit [Nitrosospira multiformis ATCC 25196]